MGMRYSKEFGGKGQKPQTMINIVRLRWSRSRTNLMSQHRTVRTFSIENSHRIISNSFLKIYLSPSTIYFSEDFPLSSGNQKIISLSAVANMLYLGLHSMTALRPRWGSLVIGCR